MFHNDFLMRQYCVDRIARILRLHQLYSVAVVKAAFVAQTTFLIKDKGVRRCLGTIRPGHRLRVAIVKIGILQMLVFGADFHLGQTVAYIRGVQFIDPDRLRIVGLDRHHGHAPTLVVRG